MVLIWGGNENVLKLAVYIVAQFCEHTKKHYSVCFKWLNCIVYKLYFNKAVIYKGGIMFKP